MICPKGLNSGDPDEPPSVVPSSYPRCAGSLVASLIRQWFGPQFEPLTGGSPSRLIFLTSPEG